MTDWAKRADDIVFQSYIDKYDSNAEKEILKLAREKYGTDPYERL